MINIIQKYLNDYHNNKKSYLVLKSQTTHTLNTNTPDSLHTLKHLSMKGGNNTNVIESDSSIDSSSIDSSSANTNMNINTHYFKHANDNHHKQITKLFYRMHIDLKLMQHFANTKMNDADIYKLILTELIRNDQRKKHNTKDNKYNKYNKNNNHQTPYVSELERVVKDLLSDYDIKTVLDVGTGDGAKIYDINKQLNLPIENVKCIDVEGEAYYNENEIIQASKRCTFQKYDGITIPFADNSFDLVTILMVLHHVPELTNIIAEIKRVVTIGGCVFIKEHDANENTISYLHVLHWMYCWKKLVSTTDAINLYQNYMSADTIAKLFEQAGFKSIKKHNTNNYTGDYYKLFVRIV